MSSKSLGSLLLAGLVLAAGLLIGRAANEGLDNLVASEESKKCDQFKGASRECKICCYERGKDVALLSFFPNSNCKCSLFPAEKDGSGLKCNHIFVSIDTELGLKSCEECCAKYGATMPKKFWSNDFCKCAPLKKS